MLIVHSEVPFMIKEIAEGFVFRHNGSVYIKTDDSPTAVCMSRAVNLETGAIDEFGYNTQVVLLKKATLVTGGIE